MIELRNARPAVAVMTTALLCCAVLQTAFWGQLIFDYNVTFWIFLAGYSQYAIVDGLFVSAPSAIVAVLWAAAYVFIGLAAAFGAERVRAAHRYPWLAAFVIWSVLEVSQVAVALELARRHIIAIE